MNGEALKELKLRQAEVESLGGLPAYRLQALQNLKLKTVIKESHGTEVHALAVNHTHPSLGNLFATVGSDQATVYNGEHMGTHVSVVAQLTNRASDYVPGGELQVLAWLSTAGWADHPTGDTCLAVAGADVNISVISVVEARVVRLLRGHTRAVVDLAAAAAAPRLLLSLSRDGNLRLWDVPSEACLSSIQTDATCIAFAPDAASVLTGSAKGKLQQYMVTSPQNTPAAAADPTAAAARTDLAGQQPSILEASRRQVQCTDSLHTAAIDCMQFLPGPRLAIKYCDGRMSVCTCIGSGEAGLQLETASAWRVPGCTDGGSAQHRARFGSTADGQFIAVGNSRGECFVYNSSSGERVAHLPAVRVSAPVRACALSEDCRHLLAVMGKGFVFRYEYQGPLALQQQQQGEPTLNREQQEDKENANALQQAVA